MLLKSVVTKVEKDGENVEEHCNLVMAPTKEKLLTYIEEIEREIINRFKETVKNEITLFKRDYDETSRKFIQKTIYLIFSDINPDYAIGTLYLESVITPGFKDKDNVEAIYSNLSLV